MPNTKVPTVPSDLVPPIAHSEPSAHILSPMNGPHSLLSISHALQKLCFLIAWTTSTGLPFG